MIVFWLFLRCFRIDINFWRGNMLEGSGLFFVRRLYFGFIRSSLFLSLFFCLIIFLSSCFYCPSFIFFCFYYQSISIITILVFFGHTLDKNTNKIIIVCSNPFEPILCNAQFFHTYLLHSLIEILLLCYDHIRSKECNVINA